MSNEIVIEVEDVASYIKFINGLSPIVDGDARTYESTFVFRGQGSIEYELLPSITRDDYCPYPGPNTFLPIVGSLVHEANFIKLLAAYCQLFSIAMCFRLIS